MRTLVFLHSHPIQYFAPLYRELEAGGFFHLEVWYGSQHGLSGELDRQFGTSVQWDIPVLAGYRHIFLKNYSPRPSIYGFTGLFHPGIVAKLWRLPRRSIVVVHGWAYLSNWMAIFFARLFGHTVCLRGESPLSHEQTQVGFRKSLRNWLLRRLLFPGVDRFLYIGQQNRLFYRHFGVPESKFLFAPYSVDNRRFQEQANALMPAQKSVRESLGLPTSAFIVLFAGKFIPKKRPLDLLKALAGINDDRVFALFVGEGALRHEMETFIHDYKLGERARLTGFINQSDIGRYYASADLFVMCSDAGETWGLATNEAMNFGLPVVVSDLTGCGDDLVITGQNGFVFPTGDVERLKEHILFVCRNPQWREKATELSKTRIAMYSYGTVVENMAALSEAPQKEESCV